MATYEQTKAWAKTRTTQELLCRTGRHNWQVLTREYIRGYGYYLITDQCGNGCGLPRLTEQDALGDIMWRTIQYAVNPGYLSTQGRITGSNLAAVRAELLTRFEIHTSLVDRPPHTQSYVHVANPSRRKRA